MACSMQSCDGSLYHCTDFNCPDHGKRNREMAGVELDYVDFHTWWATHSPVGVRYSDGLRLTASDAFEAGRKLGRKQMS